MVRYFSLCLLCLHFLAAISGSHSAQAAEYAYSQDKSRLDFTLSHFGWVTVKGHFKSFAGFFQYHPDRPGNSEVRLVIQTASVASDHPDRERDMKTEHFFWPEKYPEIRFVSREVQNIRGRQFDIHGDLTIRGITNPVVFATTLDSDIENTDVEKTLLFHTETYIKRRDFQLGKENWFDPFLFITGETLKISLHVVGTVVTET